MALGMTDRRASGACVAVLTTGGTIAMRHDDQAGGAVPQLGAADFRAALPDDVPELLTEEIANLPSSHFSLETLETVRDRVADWVVRSDVAGVVVTHGTDTMEETAYLLDLTVPGDKPILLTGAMRTASEVGYDGYANLLAAVRVARASRARGIGAAVVFNDEIHSARHVTKMHTLSTATFQSPFRGPIGRVEGREVIVDQLPRRDLLSWRGLEPKVALVKLTVGADPGPLEYAQRQGARGIVVEALGGGRVPAWWLPSIEQARERGLSVVIASRCPSGRVWDSYGYPGAYRSLMELGCLFTRGINGQKARVRLMTVLAAAETDEKISALWESGTPSTE